MKMVGVVLAALLAGTLVSGCAGQQAKFDTIGKRDQVRYFACRAEVLRTVCRNDPECGEKAGEFYAYEPAESRMQWLIDYGCTRDKIQHADAKLTQHARGRVEKK